MCTKPSPARRLCIVTVHTFVDFYRRYCFETIHHQADPFRDPALFQSDPFITFIFSTGGIILKPYIIKRILSAIPLLLIISFVCFVFINLIPSDPAEVALRVRQVPIITEDAIAEVRSQLGLDKPYLVRYFTWVLDCLHGDFGISYVNPSRTVAGELLPLLWLSF